jgi:lipoate-protein ligase A
LTASDHAVKANEHSASHLVPVSESRTFDPVLNLIREADYMKTVEAPAFRSWRCTDSVVLGRFLKPEEEVHLERATEFGVPILRRPSGGGAVFHDLGNVNYSVYLPWGQAPSFGIEDSLRALSFPVIEVLKHYGVPWSWVPPNNIYVLGRKISGSAQARSGGRLLHHGSLLVDTDLDRMHSLLKEDGRSTWAPVLNLSEVVKDITVEEVTSVMEMVLSCARLNSKDTWMGFDSRQPIEAVIGE